MGVEFLVERVELWIVARERRLDRLLEIDDIELCVAGSRLAANSAADAARDLTHGFMTWLP
jgi:hypothetical protein